MNPACLPDLACRAPSPLGPCGGVLALAEDKFPVRLSKDGDDLDEGLLRCETCGSEYPVLCGVAVLVANVDSYLAARAGEILTSTAGFPMSSQAVDYVIGGTRGLYDRGHQSSLGESLGDVQTNIGCHYGTLTEAVSPGHPLYRLIADYEAEGNFYDRTLAMTTAANASPVGRAIDIGCNVGGMTWRLARHCEFVYGIDISFRTALTARRILLHRPSALGTYRVLHEGLRSSEQVMEVDRVDNVEFMVASAADLPFRPAAFDLGVSLNVLEMSDPAQLVGETLRVVRPGGAVTFSDPYGWGLQVPIERWLGTRPAEPSNQALRTLLARSCDIVDEQDPVMWIIRGYDRLFAIWLTDLVVARRRAEAADSSPPPR